MRVGILTGRMRELTDSGDWRFEPVKHNGMRLAFTLAPFDELSEIAHRAQGEQKMSTRNRDWRELCELASKEQNPEKLRALIAELIKVLDERKIPQQPQQT